MKDFIRLGEKEKIQEEMVLLFILKTSLIILTVFLVGCSSLPRNMEWDKAKNVGLKWKKLQRGDIIVKNKKLDPLSWFGHAAIMIDDNYIGDYPKVGVNYYELDPYSWLYERRNVVVLRYKYYDERFEKKLIENIAKYNQGKYRIHFDKTNKEKFYCSQFIWLIYHETAKELGYELDLDSDGGGFVTPYDLLYSNQLIQVDFE